MIKEIRPALVLLVLLSLLTGLAYPYAITNIAHVFAPSLAEGSLISHEGKLIGSALVGQNFASERYFHPRPSAITGTDPKDSSKTIDTPYDASNSNASNLAPTSQKLVDRVKGSVEAWKKDGGKGTVPSDAVMTSASGLDPDISPANALGQVARVAKARGLKEANVQRLVEEHIEQPHLGFIGEPHINVLALNLELDVLSNAPH